MKGRDRLCTIIVEDWINTVETMIPEDIVEEWALKLLDPLYNRVFVKRTDGSMVAIRTSDIVRIEVA